MNSRIKIVEGVVVEHGAYQRQNQDELYSFVTIKQSDGSLIKINNAITNNHVGFEIRIENHVKFYVRKFHSLQKPNFIFASESSRGFNFYIPPLRPVIAALLQTIVISPVLIFLGFFFVGQLFSANPDLATVISAWPLFLMLYYVYCVYLLRADAIDLKQELSKQSTAGTSYETAKVTNI